MTTKELNRDIKRMYASCQNWVKDPNLDENNDVWMELQEEYCRLFMASDYLRYGSQDAKIAMISMASAHRFMRLHEVVLHIEPSYAK